MLSDNQLYSGRTADFGRVSLIDTVQAQSPLIPPLPLQSAPLYTNIHFFHFFFINCIIKYCCFILLATGCDGLGSTGSLSHFIYMFIHLYVWCLCEKK